MRNHQDHAPVTRGDAATALKRLQSLVDEWDSSGRSEAWADVEAAFEDLKTLSHVRRTRGFQARALISRLASRERRKPRRQRRAPAAHA